MRRAPPIRSLLHVPMSRRPASYSRRAQDQTAGGILLPIRNCLSMSCPTRRTMSVHRLALRCSHWVEAKERACTHEYMLLAGGECIEVRCSDQAVGRSSPKNVTTNVNASVEGLSNGDKNPGEVAQPLVIGLRGVRHPRFRDDERYALCTAWWVEQRATGTGQRSVDSGRDIPDNALRTISGSSSLKKGSCPSPCRSSRTGRRIRHRTCSRGANATPYSCQLSHRRP